MDIFYKELLKLDGCERFDHSMPMVLTLHMLTEYWLNRLVENSQEIRHQNSYKKKLKLVKRIGLLPTPLHENLKALNNIRDRYAHELGYSFIDEGIELKDQDLKAVIIGDNDERNAIYELQRLTLTWLNEYCHFKRGLAFPDDNTAVQDSRARVEAHLT